jgi:hypothetical protein
VGVERAAPRLQIYEPNPRVKQQYTVKKASDIPVPSRDVTHQAPSGRKKFNYARPGRVWQVTSRLGAGMSQSFFYSVQFYAGMGELNYTMYA